MARRIFGRGRANTTTGTISKPTLTYTDALPRDDLQDLGQISATNVQPAASSGWSRRQEIPANASGFDFRVTEPPEEAVKSDLPTDRTVDDAMIGIALASPGAVASPYSATKSNDEPVISEINTAQDARNDASGSLRRRPSKWKKLGGLFKGKQNPPKTSNLPFYQVQINDQPLQSSSEFLPGQGLPSQTRYGLQQDSVRSNKDRDHTEEWPRYEDGSRLDGHSGKERARDDQGHSRTGPNARINSSESKASGSGPLLQVEIPDIHMERYSVMFGSVLGNKQPPGLLARRSKTLDKLKVATDEPNTLEPQRSRRRATSPVPSKSPAFTLFPHAPAAEASKNAGSHTSPNRSLHRSQTAPAESMRTIRSKDQALLTVPDASPAPTSGSQDPWGSDASPQWSDSDAAILKSKPVKSYVDETKEPVWEMVTAKRTESPESMTRSSKSTPATTPEDIPPMTPPKDYPPAGGQMIPSFHATRERVDQVMTSRRNQQPSSTTTTPNASSPSEKTRHRAATPGKEKESESGSRIPDDNTVSPMTPAPLPTPSSASSEKTPKIEISIARSVSVSRGPKQTLVPLGARPDQFARSDERLVEKQPLVPTVVDVRRGHRPEKSQDVLIETV